MKRELQALTWRDVQRLVPSEIDTIILPVGTVEAHGASCIGADNYIPDSLAAEIAPRINALIAPIVNHGITRSLNSYPGSSTIGVEVFINYIKDILVSYHHSKFKNIIILNGHGGNNSALKSLALDINHQLRLNVAVLHWWELCAEVTESFYGESGAHAGLDETAMVQAIDPTLADSKQFDPEMIYTFVRGADVYPVPGTILTGQKGQGAPNFDVERAKEYYKKVVEEVGAFAEFVIKRWREADLC